MKKIALTLALLAACGGWSHKDFLLEAAYITVASGDEVQTQWTTHHCTETNPLMGACGEVMSAGSYFFVSDVLHLAISLALPPDLRTVWQAATVGSEAATVWKNYGDGVTFWP